MDTRGGRLAPPSGSPQAQGIKPVPTHTLGVSMLPNRRNDMARSRPITFLGSAAVIPLIALAVAACAAAPCGGGGAPPPAEPPPAPSKTTTAPAKTATVRIAKSSLGSILINAAG